MHERKLPALDRSSFASSAQQRIYIFENAYVERTLVAQWNLAVKKTVEQTI
jgi:hypothetical protein